MDICPKHLIIMGVSGSGKSSFGKALAAALSWQFIEGDDFHPLSNKSKMMNGIPLDDEDRLPWLKTLASKIGDCDKKSISTITSCSALKHQYRDILRTSTDKNNVYILHLDGSDKVISTRLSQRSGHFFPSNLLTSQVQSLEPLSDNEAGMVISVEHPLDQQIKLAKQWLSMLA